MQLDGAVRDPQIARDDLVAILGDLNLSPLLVADGDDFCLGPIPALDEDLASYVLHDQVASLWRGKCPFDFLFHIHTPCA